MRISLSYVNFGVQNKLENNLATARRFRRKQKTNKKNTVRRILWEGKALGRSGADGIETYSEASIASDNAAFTKIIPRNKRQTKKILCEEF